MNFEQLLRIILTNSDKIFKNKNLFKRMKIYLKNYFFLLNLKLKKLKLGLVSFEIKQFFFGNIFLYDVIEMRYSRQDTTQDDEMRLDYQLEATKWKWDFQNISAFLIIFIFLFYFIKFNFDLLIKDLFSPFFKKEELLREISSNFIKQSFNFNKFFDIPFYIKKSNDFFVQSLLKFFIYFKII